jgi:hypothetical protein
MSYSEGLVTIFAVIGAAAWPFIFRDFPRMAGKAADIGGRDAVKSTLVKIGLGGVAVAILLLIMGILAGHVIVIGFACTFTAIHLLAIREVRRL